MKLCKPCQRQLVYLKKKGMSGGRWCGICGMWRWDKDGKIITGLGRER